MCVRGSRSSREPRAGAWSADGSEVTSAEPECEGCDVLGSGSVLAARTRRRQQERAPTPPEVMPREAKRQSSSERGEPMGRRMSVSAAKRPEGCASGGTVRHEYRTLAHPEQDLRRQKRPHGSQGTCR